MVPHFFKLILAAALFVAGAMSGRADTVLPPGFTERQVVAPGDIAYPTAMAFTPDGRIFVCEQGGLVRIIKNDVLQPQPLLSVNPQFFQERGLVGLTIDPNFAVNGYVYVYYTAALPVPHNRVSRFTTSGDSAVPGSETVLIDLPPLGDAGLHNAGGLGFGPDGMLYIAVGDNLRSTNSASLLTPLGKLLRIAPDGTIPTDNPFYNVTTGVNQSIWAMGLRNPFTFTFQRTTGRLFIKDVGNGLWEEINEGMAGANYGWPRWEGASPATDRTYTTPLYTYPHPTTQPTSSSITGGAFYNPITNQFPAQYIGKYFFMDGTRQWIKVLDPVTLQVTEFAPTMNTTLGTMPLYLTVAPDGSLYYVGHFSQAIFKIQYTGVASPQIGTQPAAETASVGRPATFSVAAYGAAPLAFQWQRLNPGDAGFGDIAGATDENFTLPAASLSDNGAQFRVRVTNGVGQTNSLAATLTVTTAQPPTATILQPSSASFSAGETIQLQATATGSDGVTPLPPSAFTWAVVFHHQDHTHPFVPFVQGVSATNIVIPVVGETSDQVWYRIHLTVTDPNGLTAEVTKDIVPRRANMIFATSPPGLQIGLDGIPVTTPATVVGVVGVARTLSASAQVLGGTTYEFISWSDGGAATHAISTPASDTTYAAIFRPVTTPTDNAAFVSQSFLSSMAAGQTYGVTIAMKNNGTTAWDPGTGYYLASAVPDDNTTWGMNRVTLPGPVAPGETATFRFNVTAPTASGIYTMQWRMIRDGVSRFGDLSTAVPVSVLVQPAAAAFVSQNAPSVVNAGQRYSVSVSFKNVGTNIWSEVDRWRLGSQNPRDNTTWGASRATLTGTVAPGQTATFTFNITAPSTPGLYSFQWRMVQDGFKAAGFFGDTTPNLQIEVRNAGNAAVFVSQNVPTAMQPGQRVPVTVVMRNTGTTTWTPEAKHRLSSANPVDNYNWGFARVFLTAPVAPGDLATFNFTTIAPTNAGLYNFQWRMVQENVNYFGDPSPNIAVAVGTGTDDAAFISQNVPPAMDAGRTFPITVVMRNTGTLIWPAGGVYSLGSQNPADNLTWGINRVSLPNAVAPGETLTLNFTVQAPVATGPYGMQWRNYRDGVGYFGQPTAIANVNVFAPFDDARTVSQNFPTTMIAGATYPVSITMTNTGTTTWSTSSLITENITLGYKPVPTSMLWGLNRVALPNPVPPGTTVTFNFQVTAPATPGNYDFQWAMVKGPVGFLGTFPPVSSVQVIAGSLVDDAAFDSQIVPPSAEVGRTYTATVAFRNAGTTTWTPGNYFLGSRSPADNTVWGPNRISLPSSVAPGQLATFTFNIQAPASPGPANFQWGMVRADNAAFGDSSPNFPIPVTAPANAAAPVSQNFPPTMTGGASYNVTVVMRNTGSAAWNPGAGYQLVLVNTYGPAMWGVTNVPLVSTVNPGDTAVFQFPATAPVVAGSYNCQWQMFLPGLGLFGAPTPSIGVTVTGVDLAADFVAQTVPATMNASGTYTASLTFRNAGMNTWTSDLLYRLGARNPDDNRNFGFNRVALPATVNPGDTVTFNFGVQAPASPGSYNFQWQMVRDPGGWFGAVSPPVNVAVVGAAAPDSAAFVSQSVPSTMTAGQPYRVSVTFANTGSATWARETRHRLGSSNPRDNRTWNVVRVLLPGPVAPGSNATFTFTILAPATPGTYDFRWQMVHDGVGWFGDITPPTPVTVTATPGGPTNAATFVSQTPPSSLTTGQGGNATITLRNTGTTTWSTAAGYHLGSQNSADNFRWGLNRVDASGPVAPGATATFTIPFTAPATAGTYPFQWQMIQDGVGFFGDLTPNINVTVNPTVVTPSNAATFVSQTPPSGLTTGQRGNATITLRNTGTTTWSAATGYHLGSQNPADNFTWGFNRVDASGPIAPGATATFTIPVTAPATAGNYPFQWQMIQDGVGFFGDLTPNVSVSIADTSPPANNGSAYISQNMPLTLNTGQNVPVTVTLRNSGTTTWTSAAGYHLVSQNPAINSTWTTSLVPLPASVAPGTSVTFNFNIIAPATAGTYNLQWQMYQDGTGVFGDATPNIPVIVSAPAVNDATFVSQNIPATLTNNQVTTITVAFRNSGTTTWTTADNYRRASQNPADNTTWSLNRVALPASVAPGSTATFTFNVTAPATAGTANMQWRMIQDGVGLFGDTTPNVAVNVTAPPPPAGGVNSAFVSQSVATTVKKGSMFFVTIRFQNTGTTSWPANSVFKLGMQNPAGNSTWGFSRALLALPVAPGGTASFTVLATAPATPASTTSKPRCSKTAPDTSPTNPPISPSPSPTDAPDPRQKFSLGENLHPDFPPPNPRPRIRDRPSAICRWRLAIRYRLSAICHLRSPI